MKIPSVMSAATWLGLAATSGASVLANLNSSAQLSSDFTAGFSNTPSTHATTGGLGDSGCTSIPQGNDVTMTSVTGYTTQVGGAYTVGAYFYNVFNSGYGAQAFASG